MKFSDFIINEDGNILSFYDGYLHQFPVCGVCEIDGHVMFQARAEAPGWRDIDHYDDYYDDDEFKDEYWWKK